MTTSPELSVDFIDADFYLALENIARQFIAKRRRCRANVAENQRRRIYGQTPQTVRNVAFLAASRNIAANRNVELNGWGVLFAGRPVPGPLVAA
jgi:hypothetical protein